MSRPLLPRLLLLALAPGVATPALVAQTPPAPAEPKLFYACYDPFAGLVYRIKEPGLREACLRSTHVQFSWTDGLAAHDHGALNGLADDDHPHYLLASGTRALTGDFGAGGFKVTGLGAGAAPGDAVRFEQAVKAGDAASGDLVGTYPNPTVEGLQGRAVSATAPSNGQVLTFNGASWAPADASATGTPANVPNTLVKRDADGSFAGGTISATLFGFRFPDGTQQGTRAHFSNYQTVLNGVTVDGVDPHEIVTVTAICPIPSMKVITGGGRLEDMGLGGLFLSDINLVGSHPNPSDRGPGWTMRWVDTRASGVARTLFITVQVVCAFTS